MKFGTGLNTELTQKYARVKVQNDIRMSTHIYKQTNMIYIYTYYIYIYIILPYSPLIAERRDRDTLTSSGRDESISNLI